MVHRFIAGCLAVAITAVFALNASASSHREAPFVAAEPKLQAADFYLFRSYEAGRENFVTAIMTFLPHQYPGAGPNYHWLDDNAVYAMNFDTDGNARQDLRIEFRFETRLHDIPLNVGGQPVSIPLMAIAPMSNRQQAMQFGNLQEDFRVSILKGKKKKKGPSLTHVESGERVFVKVPDYVGTRTYPAYVNMAREYIYPVAIPGCEQPGRIFVGQRKASTPFNRGKFYDLFNLNLTGSQSATANPEADFNVTAIALELHRDCFGATSPTIGAWGTVELKEQRKLKKKASINSVARHLGKPVQVSRIGSPLLDDLIIGLADHNRYHNSMPHQDGLFEKYYSHPAIPELARLTQGIAPPAVPRADLAEVYLTGIAGLNQTAARGEMLRLNLDQPITPRSSQNNLGFLGGDPAGFPNGRRPGDDVVDITLRLLFGARANGAPMGRTSFTDQVRVTALNFDASFPYLTTPVPGNK